MKDEGEKEDKKEKRREGKRKGDGGMKDKRGKEGRELKFDFE